VYSEKNHLIVNGTNDLTAKLLCSVNNNFNLTRYNSVKIMKEIGFNAVQLRPVAVDNIRGKENKGRFSMEKELPIIHEQLERIFNDLEDENFDIYAVTHKFSKDLGRAIKFKKCRATPIQGVFGADGNFYICFNLRGLESAKLCSHFPDPYEVKRAWGSAHHKEIMTKIDPINTCIRCTYNRYNQVIEEAIMEDKIFWKFP
jgi:hypothetical protein